MYSTITSVTPVPKGITVPPLINPIQVWDYDSPDWSVFDRLPDFLKDKIKASLEYVKLKSPNETHLNGNDTTDTPDDDLPF
jgi:hypothetical protein